MKDVKQKSGESWSNVTSIGDLTISFINNAQAHEAQIYGNSRNQVGVLVTIEALDAKQQPVILSASDLWNVLSFCDYSNTSDLMNGGKNGWVNGDCWWVTNQPSAYTVPISYGDGAEESLDPLPAGYSSCQCYIFWDPSGTNPSNSKDFAVKVTLPNGLTYTTGVESSTFDNYMHVDAKPQIQYLSADLALETDNAPAFGRYNYYSIDQAKHPGNNIAVCTNVDRVSTTLECYCFTGGNPTAIKSNWPGLFISDWSTKNSYNDNTGVLWEMSADQSVTVAVPQSIWVKEGLSDWEQYFQSVQAPANVKRYAVCVTISVTDTHGYSGTYGTSAGNYGNFTIYDQYGNAGDFSFDRYMNLVTGHQGLTQPAAALKSISD